MRRLTETTGPNRSLDLPGLGLVSAGLFGVVFGLVRASEHGWSSLGVAGPLAVGAALVAAFVAWELRAKAPMVAMRFFRSRQFSAAIVTSLFMFFGMFGSVFLLAQFFQVVQGYTPLDAGLRRPGRSGRGGPGSPVLPGDPGPRPAHAGGTIGVAGGGRDRTGQGWLAFARKPASATVSK